MENDSIPVPYATVSLLQASDSAYVAGVIGGEDGSFSFDWRKRSIPTHSGWLYPLTFDAGKGLKEA